MNAVPDQFTIAFWVRPVFLSSTTYFVNAFDRISITAQSASNKVYFSFSNGPSSYVQPNYMNDYNQEVVLNSWNYVAVSQKEYVSGSVLKY